MDGNMSFICFELILYIMEGEVILQIYLSENRQLSWNCLFGNVFIEL